MDAIDDASRKAEDENNPKVCSEDVVTDHVNAIINSRGFGKIPRILAKKAMDDMSLDKLVDIYKEGTFVKARQSDSSPYYTEFFDTTIDNQILDDLRDSLVDSDEIIAFKLSTDHPLITRGVDEVSGTGGYTSSETVIVRRGCYLEYKTIYYRSYSTSTDYFDKVLKSKAIKRLEEKLQQKSKEEVNEELWRFVVNGSFQSASDKELALLVYDCRNKVILKSKDIIKAYEAEHKIDILETLKGLFYDEHTSISSRMDDLSEDTKNRLFSLKTAEILPIALVFLSQHLSREVDKKTLKIEEAYAKVAPAIDAYKNLVIGREFIFPYPYHNHTFRTRTSSTFAANTAIERFVSEEYETAKTECLHIRSEWLDYIEKKSEEITGRKYWDSLHRNHVNGFLPTSQLGKRLRYPPHAHDSDNDNSYIIKLLKEINKEAEKRNDTEWLEPFGLAIYFSRINYIKE